MTTSMRVIPTRNPIMESNICCRSAMAYGTKKSSSKGKGKKGNKVCKTDSGHRPATPVEIAAFAI